MFKKWLVLLGIPALALILLVFISKRAPSPPQDPQDKWNTLSYLNWTPAADTMKKAGVMVYDRSQAYDGYNLYCSKHSFTAHLLDMQGNEVHRWSKKTGRTDFWHHVQLCPNGDLLVIVKDKMLMRLDRHSRIRWKRRLRFHHDIFLTTEGEIYTISRRDGFVWHGLLPFPVLQDFITVLSSSGTVKRKIPVYPIVEGVIARERLLRIYAWLEDPTSLGSCRSRKRQKGFFLRMDTPVDILHTNAVEVINYDIPGICRKKDLLISVRELELIGVVDQQSGRMTWHWGPGILEKPHHPRLLANGNILVFDNGFDHRNYSRVLEYNPLSREIVWEYRAVPPRKFFSRRGGACQRLPNGNTLITESDRGRVFEVTPGGEIVWEFFNPHLKKKKKRRATIYRMMRINEARLYPWLKGLPVN